MLNPDQVRHWHAAVETNPGWRQSFDGYHLAAVPLAVPAEPLPHPGERAGIGRMYPPAQIFGTPFDPNCLNGVGTYPVHAHAVAKGSHRNARVVGPSALLTEAGLLLSPSDVRLWGRQAFIERSRSGHQGYLLEQQGDDVVLRFVARPTPRLLELDALFLHNLESGNFGSFMFRQLPQMLLARAAGTTFDCYITGDRVPWFFEALSLLGFPPRPVFTVREIAGEQFRSVTMYDGFDLEGYARPEIRASLAELVGRLSGPPAPPRRRIYVSRLLSGLSRPWYRVMQNEQAVEQHMRRRGFEVIQPETLSLKAQADIFATASHVVGPSGSGMFNTMFAHGKLRVVDIETFMVTVRQHAKLYASLDADYAFVFAPMDPSDTRQPEHRRWELPIPLLDQALDWALAG